jgi:predicted DNA-binding transcriptional regulator YafY
MDRSQRIYKLHQILKSHRLPVSHRILQERLESSRATVNRVIQEMRLYFDAPIEYDRERNGYYYATAGDRPFELPGLWFNASELYALLAMQQLLAEAQPGLFESQLAPLKTRIEKILASEHLGQGEISRRVRILRMAGRHVPDERFQTAAAALLQRKRLHIHYRARGAEQESQREISPQRLVHYRDNWYLDAWCHKRNALRTFALERIFRARTLETAATDIPDDQLDAHFAAGYGIFAGPASHTAILRFTPESARWVADEEWHPRQESSILEDGRYELRVPYSEPTELVKDILKFGLDVEVVGPETLRSEVVKRLADALAQYRNE